MLDIVSKVEPTLQRKIPDGSPAHLFNMNGKCLSSVNANGYSGQWLVQLDCLAHRDDQKWSFDNQHLGSGNSHICNSQRKCVTDSSRYYDHIIYQTEHSLHNKQMFHFEESPISGYYYIKNNEGKCLTVQNNSGYNGDPIIRSVCHTYKSGELWKWLPM